MAKTRPGFKSGPAVPRIMWIGLGILALWLVAGMPGIPR